jgi:hypothetical protein
MRKLLVLVALTALLGSAGVAIADPHLILTADPHRHFVNIDGTRVEVGPRYCDNANLRGAFAQFHANTHTHNGVTGAIGPVAPGLHNQSGPELSAGRC